MKIEKVSFGSIKVDGKEFKKDIIIEKGKIKPRGKSASRKYKHIYGHTPLTTEENIPWDCETLVIASGFYGALPIKEEVIEEAKRRGVDVKIVRTIELPEVFSRFDLTKTNFVIHLTC